MSTGGEIREDIRVERVKEIAQEAANNCCRCKQNALVDCAACRMLGEFMQHLAEECDPCTSVIQVNGLFIWCAKKKTHVDDHEGMTLDGCISARWYR